MELLHVTLLVPRILRWLAEFFLGKCMHPYLLVIQYTVLMAHALSLVGQTLNFSISNTFIAELKSGYRSRNARRFY
jgi:hypothetical protein